MRIESSVAVVTGGASGLGEAVVRLFHDLGCKVAIWDQNSKTGESLSSSLGPNTIFCKVDVTSESSVLQAISSTLKSFQRIDILVNSAGVWYGKMTVTSKYLHSLEDFTRVININLCGTFNVSRLVAKVMKDQSEVNGERGNIVNVASIAGFDGQRGNTAYLTFRVLGC